MSKNKKKAKKSEKTQSKRKKKEREKEETEPKPLFDFGQLISTSANFDFGQFDSGQLAFTQTRLMPTFGVSAGLSAAR